MNRLLNLLVAAGLAYVAGHALVAGVGRPDYILMLFGLLFVTLSAIALLIGLRRVEGFER